MLGGAIGTKTLADEDSGNGSSRVADKAIADADFPDKADEQVLDHSAQRRAHAPATRPSRPRVDDVVAQPRDARQHVDEVESPLAKGNEGQISKDGRSALVTF